MQILLLCLVLSILWSKRNPIQPFRGTVSYCSSFMSLSELLIPCRQLSFCLTSYFWRDSRGSISFLRQLLIWIRSVLHPQSPAACKFCALPDFSHLEADLPLHSCPCPILGAFCCLHPMHAPLIYPSLPSVSLPLHGAQPGHFSNPGNRAWAPAWLRWRLGGRTAVLLSWHRVRKRCSCWLLCFLNLLDDIAIDLGLCWDDLNSGMVEEKYKK